MNRGRPVVAAVVAALLSGASLWAAHPPVGAWPTSFVTVPLLLLAVHLEVARARREEDRPRVFVLGIVAGVAGYGPMIQWLVLPAGVLGWGLLVLVQAAWTGAFAVIIRRFVTSGWIVLVAPVAWAAMDAWRASVPLGGFEWGALAYAHVDGSWLLPLARLLGGRGITLMIALLGTLLYEIGRRITAARSGERELTDLLKDGVAEAQPAFLGLAGALLVSVVAVIGPPATSGESLDVVAVQGNDIVDWGRGGGADEDRAIADRMLGQTRAAVAEGGVPDLTVWPESSLDRDPFSERGADLRPVVEEAAADVEGDLLVGVNLQGEEPGTFRNAAVLLGRDGRPLDRYVKRQLVPFGEYVPFRSVLGEFPPLRQVPRDGVPGEGPQPMEIDGARLAVAICFESMFPALVHDNVAAGGDRAGLLIVTTNDASFGRSAEPAQHLAQSRLRAVETGRWVVHAALSGSSAFVDPGGGVHQPTDLFVRTWIRREIPLVEGATPFLTTGDVTGLALRVAGGGLLAWVLVLGVADRRRHTEVNL